MSRSLVPSDYRRIPVVGFFSDPFFSDPFFASPMPLLQNVERDLHTLRHSSPCYEITENDKQFQLSVDVPGLKAEDMTVQVEQGGKVLRLKGEKKKTEGNTVSRTSFEKSFTLGANVDRNKITANLADGVIVVTVPKETKQEMVQNIPITYAPTEPSVPGGMEKMDT